MARIIKARCRLCRREGIKLFLKGERCYSPKCPITRKGALPPGQHGSKKRGKQSNYGMQLREKQKVKRIYGILEKQLKNYYQKAVSQKKEAGLVLLRLLESRLDNLLFRSGIVLSRNFARQLISHNYVLVDNKKVNIPSYQVKPGQIITLKEKALKLEQIKKALEQKNPSPKWLKRQVNSIKYLRLPERKEIEGDINEHLIIEFYSK